MSAANGAAEGNEGSLRVLTVTSADRVDAGRSAGDMRLGAGAWWSTVVRDVLDEVDEEIIVFLEISSLVVFNGAMDLARELKESDAAAIASRILDPRGVTIAFDRGRFDVLAHRESECRGFVATSVPMRQRPSLFFDGRAFAARRSALVAVGPPSTQLEDELGDVDWCWRLWLAGHRVLTSARTSVLECEPDGKRPSGACPLRCATRARIMLRFACSARCSRRTISPEPSQLRLRSAGRRPEVARTRSSATIQVPSSVRTETRRSTASRFPPHCTRSVATRRSLPNVRPSSARASSETSSSSKRWERSSVRPRQQPAREPRFVTCSSPVTSVPDPRVLILCSDNLGTSMAGPCDPERRACACVVAGRRSGDRRTPRRSGGRSPVSHGDCVRRSPAHLACGRRCCGDPGPGQRLVSGGASQRRPDRGRPVRPDAPRGAAASRCGRRASVRAEPGNRAAPPRRLLLLCERAPARLLARHALDARTCDARGLRGGSRPAKPDRRRSVWHLGGCPRAHAGARDTVDGIGPDDVLLVWNGGLWDWFDTETFLRALAQVREELPMLRAYFMGVRRPGLDRACTCGAQGHGAR